MICDVCDGTGEVSEYCSLCNGSGEGTFDGSTCSECFGTGEVGVKCEVCNGEGEILEHICDSYDKKMCGTPCEHKEPHLPTDTEDECLCTEEGFCAVSNKYVKCIEY